MCLLREKKFMIPQIPISKKYYFWEFFHKILIHYTYLFNNNPTVQQEYNNLTIMRQLNNNPTIQQEYKILTIMQQLSNKATILQEYNNLTIMQQLNSYATIQI